MDGWVGEGDGDVRAGVGVGGWARPSVRQSTQQRAKTHTRPSQSTSPPHDRRTDLPPVRVPTALAGRHREPLLLLLLRRRRRPTTGRSDSSNSRSGGGWSLRLLRHHGPGGRVGVHVSLCPQRLNPPVWFWVGKGCQCGAWY